jgi:hypothetical protein
LPTNFYANFGVLLKICLPRRMLSPSGPVGIVAGSGATQAFDESTAWPGLGGAPKLTELVEIRMRAERINATANAHLMAITRSMETVLQKV